MDESHIATLSEAVSSQTNGIVLVWSYYDGSAAGNIEFLQFFVPKSLVTMHSGSSFTCSAMRFNGGMIKLVYISDMQIQGYAENIDVKTLYGLSVYNNTAVLRYVIGV